MFHKDVVVVFLLCILAMSVRSATAQTAAAKLKVSAKPMHSGKISPMIYGGFIELLDDLVVGMWSEMLNDRHFDGITRAADWCYYTGAPTIVDRPWIENDTWVRTNTNPYHSDNCAKLTASKGAPARLAQSDLATKRGMTYHFSGWFRTETPGLDVEVVLKTPLPNGKWMTLTSKTLPAASFNWTHLTCTLKSSGTTDRAVFEIRATGDGSVFVDELSLMPADNMKGWRPDVVEAVKDGHPTLLRWGGCFVDPGAYQWKNGIGNRDQRIGFQQCPWARMDPMDVGIDEFLQFCELTNTVPLVCVSFGDTVQSAVELMEYCNGSVETTWGKKRAENGHPKPYGVRYWQLGNELGDSEYVAKAVLVGKSMKEYDPKAIILSSFPGPELAQKAGQYLDYLCPHHYTPNLESCANDIEGINRIIKEYMPGRDVQIGITEWNTTGGDWGLNRGKLMTLYCSLQNAQYLNLLQRRSDIVGLANRSNLVNSYGSGMIATKPDGLYKHPSYYVMKMYADHSKPIPVTVTGSQEGLDVSACRSEDGKQLCLFAVNITGDPIDLDLDLSDYAGFVPADSEVVCDTLTAHEPELMNSWATPERVKIIKLPVEGNKVSIPPYAAAAVEYIKP